MFPVALRELALLARNKEPGLDRVRIVSEDHIGARLRSLVPGPETITKLSAVRKGFLYALETRQNVLLNPIVDFANNRAATYILINNVATA